MFILIVFKGCLKRLFLFMFVCFFYKSFGGFVKLMIVVDNENF